MTPKLLCLDYDGTITALPELCEYIIDKARALNIAVIICTMRYEHEEDSGLAQLKQKYSIPVYYTGRKAKRDYLVALGIVPTIWLDDNPIWIITDAE